MVTNNDGFSFPMMGEDLSWCKRATDLGYDIWFDPTVKVTHNKMMKLTWEGIKP
jgi:GT2 family glycosyltransferase